MPRILCLLTILAVALFSPVASAAQNRDSYGAADQNRDSHGAADQNRDSHGAANQNRDSHGAANQAVPLLSSSAFRQPLELTLLKSSDTSPVADRGRPSDTDTSAIPAEERRLNRGTFREALKKRGLTELLELHLRDFPPTEPAEAMLAKRELRLTEFADPNRSPAERMAAIAEANRILGKLIEGHPYDPRRFDWLFTLAHALLYDEAEPLITSVLYRGGSAAERQELLTLTTRALAALTSLSEQLADEYARIDKMSIRKFEQLEESGYIAHIDSLGPRADYLMLWALLYDSLPREENDRTRVHRLGQIRTRLAENPDVLDTRHEVSHVQVQALVLAGITERLLHNHSVARQHLNRALIVADHLAEPEERDRIQWAVTLAEMERIRNDRNDSRFNGALKALDKFRRRISAKSKNDFGLRLVADLLERSVYRARADAAEESGRRVEAARYREDAWRAVDRLVQEEPQRRDEIYTTLYTINGPEADPARLDPFDQCVLIAGLLFDAGDKAKENDPRLARALEVGEYFLAGVRGRARRLVPEVLFNMGVAEYRRGHPAEAAERFLAVARDHFTWGNALQAATYAVQLTAGLYNDPTLREHPRLQQLYRDALSTLVTEYTDTDTARYWRFYYAQFLDELGEYDKAAAEYALVHPQHEHHLESAFSRVRCLAAALQQLAEEAPDEVLILRQRAGEFFSVQRDFLSQANAEASRRSEPERVAAVETLLARAKLIGAEIQVLPQIDRPTQALESLNGFEAAHANQAGLIGRVWRVRLLAYERLGQLEAAARAIPAYVAADPQSAGPNLQALYTTMADDVKRLRREGDELAAQRKARVALLLAEQIVAWAERYDAEGKLADRRALTVQLAEANLEAGEYKRARELFEQYLGPDEPAGVPAESTDLRVVFGYAEALFQLGEFATALPRFNTLAVGLPPDEPIRWQSLLRDLQCRTELKQPAGDIIKVLEQQRYLHPDLGGPTLAKEYEKLLRENQRRADGG